MSKYHFFLVALLSICRLYAADIGGSILQRRNNNVACVGTEVVGYQMVSPTFCISDLMSMHVGLNLSRRFECSAKLSLAYRDSRSDALKTLRLC
jgi:hypothetical protein